MAHMEKGPVGIQPLPRQACAGWGCWVLSETQASNWNEQNLEIVNLDNASD